MPLQDLDPGQVQNRQLGNAESTRLSKSENGRKGGAESHGDIPLWLRHVVLFLREVHAWTYPQIVEFCENRISERTASKVVKAARKRKREDQENGDIYDYAAPNSRPGRPRLLQPGAENTNLARRRMHTVDKKEPFNVAIQNAIGLQVHHSVGKKVAQAPEYVQQDLVAPKRITKVIQHWHLLDKENDQDARKALHDWAVPEFDVGSIFISTDESLISVGLDPRKKQKVSHLEGEDVWLSSAPKPESQFSYMISGGISCEKTVKMPLYIWEELLRTEKNGNTMFETPQQRAEAQIYIEELQEQARKRDLEDRERAQIRGTWQHTKLSKINAEIDTHN